jgi:hypothetical protein
MNQQENSPSETEPVTVEKRMFWTIDRIVIYAVLAIAVVVALNDYRVRSQWESDFAELDMAVTMVKTPSTSDTDNNVDSTLVDSIRSGASVSNWMTERGYAIDDLHSSETENVFYRSSGIRTFYITVDIYSNGQIRSTYREGFYAWNGKPGIEKGDHAGEVTGGGGSQGGSPRASAGGGDGGEQRGGGGRSFDPEAMFTERDLDKDGFLSGDEISERMQSRVEAMDEDEDGDISKDEFVKAMAAMVAARQQSSGGGGSEAGMMELPDDPYIDGVMPDPNALPEEVDKQNDVDPANR